MKAVLVLGAIALGWGCDDGDARGGASKPVASLGPRASTAASAIAAPSGTSAAIPSTVTPTSTSPSTATPKGAPAAVGDGLEVLEGLPELGLEVLSEAQRRRVAKLLSTEESACGKAHALEVSLRRDPDCAASLWLARYIVQEAGRGVPRGALAAELPKRRQELEVRDIEVEGRPVYGSRDAPVTVVVFADFECPHCAAEAPKLQAAIDASGGKARLVFQHFPLQGHAQGRRIAMATEAALAQSNEAFWAMHDAVFADQAALLLAGDELDRRLREHAEAAGLDLRRFDGFMQYARGESRIDAGRRAGDALGIDGTPAIFVQGRRWGPHFFGGDLAGWIEASLPARR